jgi:hypothetical protein
MSWHSTTVLNQDSLREKGLFSAKYKAAWQDCLFLAMVMFLSVMLYIHKIGFYSDDWAYLSLYEAYSDKSLLGNFHTLIVSPNIRSRPVQAFLQGFVYWMFGLGPLGHHVFNTSMLMLSMWLIYFILLELRQGRMVALAIPLVFSLMPHYSTDRLWHSAFMVTLSMLLYLISLYADLRLLRTQGIKVWLWKAVSIVCLAGSALSYEIFMPLFFINPLLAWYLSKQLPGKSPATPVNKKWHYLYMFNLLAIVLVVWFKLSTATRMGTLSLGKHLYWFAYVLYNSAKISFSKFGVKLPVIIFSSLGQYADLMLIAVSVLAGAGIFVYMLRIMKKSEEQKSTWYFACLAIVGVCIFAAGFGIFLTNTNAIITPAGINNRIVLASALGVAIAFVGGIGWVSSFFSSARLHNYLFCFMIAVLSASSLFVTNIIASFWVESNTIQQQVIHDIKQRFPQLPGNSTLILDGVCPYAGPAVVFESSWDLAGALSIAYQDITIHADIVTPNMKVQSDGIVTVMYGGANHTFHAYSDKLFVYHMGTKTVHYLPSQQAAQAYFQTYNPDFDNECPPGSEGIGVEIFK